MILYKYLGFDAAKKVIASHSVGFSQPEHFNDPFDLPSYPPERAASAEEALFAGVRNWAKNQAWAKNTGILALTRTPTNPLMWAHYADQHRGVVIGIDAVKAGFTNEDSNLIPAQYGSVIYVSHRPEEPFVGNFETPLEIGGTHKFPHDHYEKLQRLFLHKPICWSYEEEVRVVKCLKGITDGESETPSGKFRTIRVNERSMYLYSIPKDALVEVYFGVRSNAVDVEEAYRSLKADYPDAMAYGCNLNDGNLSVGFESYKSVSDIQGSMRNAGE